jgi:4'-phosphopantetheinyl transferase EntD
LPRDITGSISHKDDLAVGVAALDSKGRVGVDIERCTNKAAPALLRRILTEGEKERLGRLRDVSVEEEVLLRFSFKEAVYKAIHPYLERSIDFTEVEIDPQPDGSAVLNFRLKTGEVFPYRAVWQRLHENYWLTCVYVSPPQQ